MAGDDLKWQTYKDFRYGLWARGSERDIPDGALLELTDAVAMPSGGIRAAMRWTTQVATTGALAKGITPSTGLSITGFGVFTQSLTGEQQTFLMLREGTTEHLWLCRSTAYTSYSTDFTTLTSHTMTTSIRPKRFVPFSHTSGTTSFTDFYYGLSGGTSNNNGVFKVSSSAFTVSRISSEASLMLEAHQARLVSVGVANPQTNGVFENLVQVARFSDDGTDNNIDSTANTFVVAPSRPGYVGWMQSRMPGDLSILKREHGWFQLTGAMASNPTLYETARAPVSQQLTFATETPAGLAYFTQGQGMWAYTGGPTPVHLSSQFTGTPMTGPDMLANRQEAWMGKPAFGNNFLFTPEGYVRDFRTNSWFRTWGDVPRSPIGDGNSFPFLAYDQVPNRLYAARQTNDAGIQILSASLDESSGAKTTAYSFTLPIFQLPEGRSVMREVVYGVENYVEGSQIETIVTTPDPSGGTDITTTQAPKTLTKSRHQHVRVQLNLPAHNADWFKVQTKVRSATTVEAPTVAFMRIGYSPGPPPRA